MQPRDWGCQKSGSKSCGLSTCKIHYIHRWSAPCVKGRALRRPGRGNVWAQELQWGHTCHEPPLLLLNEAVAAPQPPPPWWPRRQRSLFSRCLTPLIPSMPSDLQENVRPTWGLITSSDHRRESLHTFAVRKGHVERKDRCPAQRCGGHWGGPAVGSRKGGSGRCCLANKSMRMSI